ncbi:MAG: glucose 1-dehydrogenase [Streptomyces sp.]|nr:glucose 1-dehydrogenase [Streptomyces sp.]
MVRRFEGKTAFVTGAASGIGAATAQAFAAEGAKVAIVDIDAKGIESLVGRIQKSGGAALAIQADVSKSADVQHAISAAVAEFGSLDCAFNNAGLEGVIAPIVDVDDDIFDYVTAVNFRGAWLCTKYQVRQMLRQGGGSIVNMASAMSRVGGAGLAHYAGTKHAVLGLTRSVALEVANQNIRVNAVLPGIIRTAMFERSVAQNPGAIDDIIAGEPIGRTGSPEEVAKAVLWLSSDEASFVVGSDLLVDGGYCAQ